MASSLERAGRLKPEIRLAQAVSEFEAALSTDDKQSVKDTASKAAKSPPSIQDVLRVTAEFNQRSRRRGGKDGAGGGGRCFGTRLNSLLEAVQQFASIGDIIVGGSQNLIACGVWSLVRFTLLTVVAHSTYVDKLTHFFMVAGSSAPRYQRMALLYPHSKELQAHLHEYFIVVVQVSHRVVSWCKRSLLSQMASSTTDADLNRYQSDLKEWATCIKDEMSILTVKKMEDQAVSLNNLSNSASIEKARRQQKVTNKILDACSTFDYQTSWKEIRKLGNTALVQSTREYQQWQNRAVSSTLICTGKLGSGKSVCMANIVDDLILSSQGPTRPVAYFFCRHDIAESLKAETIIRSLVRQLLEQAINCCGKADDRLRLELPKPVLSFEEAFQLMWQVSIPRWQPCCVIDGLDECDSNERQIVVKHLNMLQCHFTAAICVSLRLDASEDLAQVTYGLQNRDVVSIPESNPEIGNFITQELQSRLENNELVLGDASLILQIHDALVRGADGMFLWVVLQIASLCSANSDRDILDALANLPKDLPSTFSRVLDTSAKHGEEAFQVLILEMVLAARRPLTTDELQEAVSVVPGIPEYMPDRLPNDMRKALACCGSLITVDEEEDTVRVVHHSAKTYLLEGSYRNMSEQTASRTMASCIITYLNFNVFDTQMAKVHVSKTQIAAGKVPRTIVSSLMKPSRTKDLALRFLGARKDRDLQLEQRLTEQTNGRSELTSTSTLTDPHPFYAYAQPYWQEHAPFVSQTDLKTFALLIKLLKTKDHDLMLTQAIKHDNFDLAKALSEADADLERWDGPERSTPLIEATIRGSIDIVRLLIRKGANVSAENDYGRTALIEAILSDKEQPWLISALLSQGGDVQLRRPTSWGMTPLGIVAAVGSSESVERMLMLGASLTESSTIHDVPSKLKLLDLAWERELLRIDKVDPLTCAVFFNAASVVELIVRSWKAPEITENAGYLLRLAIDRREKRKVELLIQHGVDINFVYYDTMTPLMRASDLGHKDIVELLIQHGAHVQTLDDKGRDSLEFASSHGFTGVMRMLLEIGSNPNRKNKKGSCPLAVAVPWRHGVKLLLEYGADPNSADNNGYTPLHHAVQLNDMDVFEDLIAAGADIETRTLGYTTPLIMAARAANIPAVKALVGLGANVHAADETRSTALHYSAKGDRTAVAVHLLLKNGAHVNQLDNSQTPLMLAAEHCHSLAVVSALLDHGADPNIDDEEQEGMKLHRKWTALHYAACWYELSVIKRLIEAMPNLDPLSTTGQTPLMVAIDRENISAVRLLASQGAGLSKKADRRYWNYVKRHDIELHAEVKRSWETRIGNTTMRSG